MLAQRGLVTSGLVSRGIVYRGIAGVSDVFNPISLNPLQWLYLQNSPTVEDKTANDLDALYVESPCVSPDGGDDWLEVLDLVGTESVTSSGGTSTPSISAGRIDFTAGTCWDLVLDSGHHFTFSENGGVKAYNSGTGANGTWQGVSTDLLWANTQNVYHRSITDGFSKVASFSGNSSYADGMGSTGLGSGNFYYRIKFLYEYKDNTFLFSDGDYSVNNRWAAIQLVSNQLRFILDGSGTKTDHIILTDASSKVSDGDLLTITVSRTGSTIAWSVNNITTAVTYTGSATDGNDYSGGSDIVIGAVNSGIIYGQFAPLGLVQFDAGTSADNLVLSLNSVNSYDDTIPNGSGTNDATLTNVELIEIPALDDGTDDCEGLGLTNPPIDIHNNASTGNAQDAANPEFLNHTFWSADGINYNTKTWADYLAHKNFDQNIVIVRPNAYQITAILTWPIDKEWTPSEYTRMISWLDGQGSIQENLIPYPVTSGGIGPSGTYYTYDGTHIYLVEDA